MKLKLPIALAMLSMHSFSGTAQIAITASFIDTAASATGLSYTASQAKMASSTNWPSNTYTYKFGDSSGYTDNVKTLKSFTAGGEGYTYNSGVVSVIKIRRVENASFASYWSTYGGTPQANPTPRDLAYYEADNTGTTTVKIKAPYTPRMEDLFQSNNIAIGIDNMFANDYVTNFNNIERMDVVIPAGLTVLVPTAQGFAVFERGDYNAHDPSKLALITAIDANGNPTAYAPSVLKVLTANYYDSTFTANRVYQPTNFTNGNWDILRRDDSTGNLKVSDKVSLSQGIGGVMIKFSDFGVMPGTTVYGYSVLAGDFPDTASGNKALDYTNATYFPTTTSGSTGAGGNDMAVITGIVKILKISGNVYHDSNGLTDNTINGTPIGKASNVQLYVNLIDTANKVVGVATVDTVTGAFTFDKLAFGNITAKISTTQGVIGATAPSAGLPSGWSSVGENYGINNKVGVGNETGVPNSAIAIKMGDQNLTNIAFGIEQTPVADTLSFAISQPISNQIIVLNGSYVGSGSPNQLTGSDPEDAPTAHSLNGNGNAKVMITSLPIHGQLYYNNVLVTVGQVISNYKKDSLSIKLNGTGYTSSSFQYAYLDDANIASPAAPYTLSWTNPLPLSLISFTAQLQNNVVKLYWETATETNVKGFSIEKSNDAKTWSAIGFQNSLSENGNSNTVLNYTFNDANVKAGNNYYRLAEVDNNQAVKYSAIRVVNVGKSNQVVIYPNPTSGKIYFSTDDWTLIKQINLTDMSGRIISTTVNVQEGLTLNVPAGYYLIQIVNVDGTTSTSQVTKK